jgi:hypothetical protein
MSKNPLTVDLEADPLRNLKNIAYRFVQSGDKLTAHTKTDFVNFCRFQICIEKHMLFHDPVWESLSDEEIIVEYQALVFSKSQAELTAFEAAIGGESVKSELDWLEDQVSKNQEGGKDYNKDGAEDEFEMTPESLTKEKI